MLKLKHFDREAHTKIRLFRKSGRLQRIIVHTIIVASILLITYPVVSTLWNNHRLADITSRYEALVTEPQHQKQQRNNQLISSAHRYNQQLTTHPIQPPPPIGMDFTHPRYGEYKQQLANSDVDYMATLTVPSAHISLPVFHGTADHTLHKGAGHMFGTHLPVGGVGTTTAIAAHTGMVDASMFDNLRQSTPGDSAFIHIPGETLHYRMIESKVVPPDATDAIVFHSSKDLLQLVTCTPYGINSERLVVTFERAPLPNPMPDLSPDAVHGFKLQWWMYLTVGVGALIVGLSLWWLAAMRRKRRTAEHMFLHNTFPNHTWVCTRWGVWYVQQKHRKYHTQMGVGMK